MITAVERDVVPRGIKLEVMETDILGSMMLAMNCRTLIMVSLLMDLPIFRLILSLIHLLIRLAGMRARVLGFSLISSRTILSLSNGFFE